MMFVVFAIHERMKNYMLYYLVNIRYSDVSCMRMRSSEVSDLEKILGNTNWTFSKNFSVNYSSGYFSILLAMYCWMTYSDADWLIISGSTALTVSLWKQVLCFQFGVKVAALNQINTNLISLKLKVTPFNNDYR